MILIITSLIIRLLSLFNRIILTRLLGNDGINLYVISLPSIMLYMSVAGFSLNTALSKVIAENTVTNKDSGCPAATFLLTTNNTPPPAGFSAVLTSLQMTLSPGQQGTATLQVISPGSAASGNYVITVTVLNSPSYSFRTNATATYVVF
jgi:hypothetical protein